MGELVFAVCLATFVSAYCSLVEAVLYSFSPSNIERLKKEGKKAGFIMERLRGNIDEPITAILTLNTVAHTVGASMAGAAWAKLFGEETLTLFAFVFTLIILLFSEILPKTVGVVSNRTLAPIMARPLLWLVWIFKPAIWSCGIMSRAIRAHGDKEVSTEDDIIAMVAITQRDGGILAEEARSITNILALDDRTVDEVMTPRTVVFSEPENITVEEIHAKHTVIRHSRFPVYKSDMPESIKGIVYRREVLEALAEDRHSTTLAELAHPAMFVEKNVTLDRVLKKFLNGREHIAIVMDDYGGIAGIVTLEDILEEIIGREIMDDTDQVADMRKLALRRKEKLFEQKEREKALLKEETLPDNATVIEAKPAEKPDGEKQTAHNAK